MTVTVVMSTYNGDKYLREQIDSILGQKNVDIVLFVRDDGSQDSTLDILGEYSAKYDNVLFYVGNNLGIGKSFYEALRLAPESDYYAFSDQDDVWLPDKVVSGVKALETFENDGKDFPLLYTCRPQLVDSNLKPLEANEIFTEITFSAALVENYVSGCTFIFNKRARDLFLAFPIENIGIHDWDLLRIVLAVGGKIFQDEKRYILYRQHGANAVGVTGGWRRRIKKLVNGHPIRELRVRLEFADRLREVYPDSIPEENRRILDRLCDYKKSFSSRMALVKSKDIARTDKTDNLIFKALFLLGLL